MTRCLAALCTSTIGVSPVTVIVSWTEPTRRSASIVAVKVPVSATPSRFTVLNRSARKRQRTPWTYRARFSTVKREALR